MVGRIATSALGAGNKSVCMRIRRRDVIEGVLLVTRPNLQFIFALIVAAATASSVWAAQDVLVTVNGEGITREALAHRLIDLSLRGTTQLEEMVNEALLFQDAKKKGITVSDAEIDARLADIKAKLGSEERFGRYLADQEVTKAGLLEKIRVKICVEKLLGDKAKVTDEEVKKAYEANKKTLGSPETVTLRMILTKTKERADDAMKRLNANENFADVAKALSEHPYTAERGGLLERPVQRANLSPALAEVAFSTEVGKYTQPVQTPDGYYILQIEAHNAATNPTFDDVKEAILAELREMKLQSAWLQWLDDARKRASIERKWQP
jgi:foldase protein PrsA